MIITDSIPLDPKNCVLNASRIDIWQFLLHNHLPQSQTILSPDELARANRFYFERHQRRFATARTRVREILGAYLGIPAAKLEFTYATHGKPEVVNQQQLQFNLSHTGDIALLAIGKEWPLGIDIEQYSARPYTGIAGNLFTPVEQEYLKQAPIMAKPALFFRMWAQKEAFIKACGLGLSYPTQQFTVPAHANPAEIIDNLHQQTWKIHSFMPGIAMSAALCYHPSIQIIRKFAWNNSLPCKTHSSPV
jgi:4'-phosphopantetheinyl transferase